MRVQSHACVLVSSRSSSDGLTRRTWSSGTTENSTETSTPTAMPCTAALQVTPYSTSVSSVAEPLSARGMAATAARANPTPRRLPARPSATT